MTYAEAGRHEEAIGFLWQSIGRSGSDDSHLRKAYAVLVSCYRNLGRHVTAWETCQQGLGRFPDDAELLFRQANAAPSIRPLARSCSSLRRPSSCPIRKARWVFRSLTGTEAEAIQAEFEVGRDLAQAVAREMEREQDPDVSRLMSDTGGRLAIRVQNKHRRFVFYAVGAAEANAFALAGGFIWVTRPLLELRGSNPDEVAFILGHEMGHVSCKHAMDRLIANSVLDTALRVAPIGGLVRSQVGGIALGLLKQRYSQDQELEADQLGVRLARSGGFEPVAAIRLLDRLKQESCEVQAIAEYFSSHPPFDLRIAHLRQHDRMRSEPCEERQSFDAKPPPRS